MICISPDINFFQNLHPCRSTPTLYGRVFFAINSSIIPKWIILAALQTVSMIHGYVVSDIKDHQYTYIVLCTRTCIDGLWWLDICLLTVEWSTKPLTTHKPTLHSLISQLPTIFLLSLAVLGCRLYGFLYIRYLTYYRRGLNRTLPGRLGEAARWVLPLRGRAHPCHLSVRIAAICNRTGGHYK